MIIVADFNTFPTSSCTMLIYRNTLKGIYENFSENVDTNPVPNTYERALLKPLKNNKTLFFFFLSFLTLAKIFGSSGTHTPLTPYRAELMREEMKYHYLRGKHTSVHTRPNCSLTHLSARIYICIYTICFLSPKSVLNCSQKLSYIKACICLF